MKKYFISFVVLITFFAFNKLLAGTYSGGAGSLLNPYHISNADDIEELMSTSTDWHKFFILTQNIDCSGYSWQTNYPSPIGNNTTKFTGNFDGRNHTISNIDISKPGEDYIGFFGYINNGTISNLGLVNVNCSGNDFGGVFCGVNNYSTITNCYSIGNANGNYEIGGFCGDNLNSTITNCYSIGNANGNYGVGGFCGYNYQSTITNCYSTCNANGSNDFVGGFCSLNFSSTITNCYSTGNANGNRYVGGFCGYNYLGSINNCYSLGKSSGSTNIGGFIGLDELSTLLCNFWGFPNASLNDIGNSGDIDDSQVKELPVTQFYDERNFPCFDLINVWKLFGNKPVLRNVGGNQFQPIPTITEWAAIIFIGLLAVIGGIAVWKRMI